MNTLRQLIRTMRPGQWVKNLFVAAPALFAKAHTEGHPEIFLRAGLAMGTFILLSGAVYVLNDVLDIEKDRAHPVKRKRPVASGSLSIQSAVAGGLLALAGAVMMGFWLGIAFSAIAIGYLVLNVAYSSVLKHIAWLDVVSIATGFLLRILAGSFAIGLDANEVSVYLVVCTFLVALFLALGKRRQELSLLGDDSHAHRSVLRDYSLRHLDIALVSVACLTAAAYTLYTLAPQTLAYFGTTRLVFTTPFVFVGIGRFLWLLRRRDDPRSPTDAMVRDLPFVLNIVGWTAVVMWAIYG